MIGTQPRSTIKESAMIKKLIAPVLVGGALHGSLAVGGSAQAATSTSTSTAGAHIPTHPGHKWLKELRKDIRKQAIVISASAIGVTTQAQADKITAALPARVARMVNRVF